MVSVKPARVSIPFTLLAKPTGAACNLACEYCFYLSREQLYPGSSFRMNDGVLEAYICQLLASLPSGEVNLAWQGGEPTLMGLDFFKRSVILANRYKRPDQHLSHSLQTNGIILNDTWCAFFKEHDFLIGLSIDGPSTLHNTFRVDKGGQGSYEQARRAWDLLQKHNVDVNILCAVHSANATHPLEVYRFFRDELDARFIQFIPIVEQKSPGTRFQMENGFQGKRIHSARKGALVSKRSVEPMQFGFFMIAIFDEWVQRDIGSVFVQLFDSALASWCGLPANVCLFRETCGLSLVLEHNGDLYSCDHFVDPLHCLGNILEKPLSELVNCSAQHQFGMEKRDRLPETCRRCEVYFACHGECPRNRFMKAPSEEPDHLNYLCAGYHSFFRHVDQPMRRMSHLLSIGRTPAEIMKKESTPFRG